MNVLSATAGPSVQFARRFYASRGAPVAPGEVNLWEEYLAWKETPTGREAAGTGLVGLPETLRKKLRRFEESNIDQVILFNQAGKNSHEDIGESLGLFAREVMPELHDREAEHQAWKRAVLDGEIELEEIDTAAHGFRRPNLARGVAGS